MQNRHANWFLGRFHEGKWDSIAALLESPIFEIGMNRVAVLVDGKMSNEQR